MKYLTITLKMLVFNYNTCYVVSGGTMEEYRKTSINKGHTTHNFLQYWWKESEHPKVKCEFCTVGINEQGNCFGITLYKAQYNWLYCFRQSLLYLISSFWKYHTDGLLICPTQSYQPSVLWLSRKSYAWHKSFLQPCLAFRSCDISMVPAEIPWLVFLMIFC